MLQSPYGYIVSKSHEIQFITVRQSTNSEIRNAKFWEIKELRKYNIVYRMFQGK